MLAPAADPRNIFSDASGAGCADSVPAAGDREPPNPQGVGAGAAVLARRAICTTRRWWSGTSTRCGTPATSRTSGLSGWTRPKCVQLVIIVREKPTIREINYKGLNAVTQSDVLERFKKAKVAALGGEPVRPDQGRSGPEMVLKDLLAEHGHQFATITDRRSRRFLRRRWSITFNIKEGPTVKVGKIAFRGQQQPERPHAARRDGEPEADRDTALDHSGEPVCADVRREQAGRGHGAGAAGATATAATSRRRRANRRRMYATRAG